MCMIGNVCRKSDQMMKGGWGGSCKGGMGYAGVGWVMQVWGGVGHARVGRGGSYRGWVGHSGVGWVI